LKRTQWIPAAAAVVVVAAAGWLWRSHSAHEAPKYRTAQVERGSIESTVSATGTVQPVEQVEVGSQVSGTVYKMHADYNSRVTAGQVLCELEPSSFRARVAQNEAAVARAEAALEDGRRQLRRARELAVQNLVSQADLETAEVTVQQRQADLKAARAQLDAVRVDLANSVIRAPISGVVISRNIDLGQTVAASLQAPKLFVIARDLTQMQVETAIDEADIGVIRVGLPVTFTVDAFPDDKFHGQVSVVRLEPILAQGVVTYTTVIQTHNPELKLRPGMTANVTVLVARHDDALKIPAAALRFRPPEVDKGGRGAAGGREVAGGGAAQGAGARAALAAAPAAEGGARGAGRGERPRGRGQAPGGGGGRPEGRGRGAMVPAADSARVGGDEAESGKPGAVYVLRGGSLVRVGVVTGLTDGTSVELLDGGLRPGDEVVTGSEAAVRGATTMAPPPGMGGPMFGRPGGGGGGGRR
jgi:HlyD family secretion protein